MSIGGDVVLTRGGRQRYKIPTYNLTTGQPLPDVKGGGNLAVNFGNSAFHSLFPEAELITVCVPKPPDRATIGGSFRRLKPIATSDLTVKKNRHCGGFCICREQRLKWDRQSAIVYLHNHGFQAVATVSFRLIPLLHNTRKL